MLDLQTEGKVRTPACILFLNEALFKPIEEQNGWRKIKSTPLTLCWCYEGQTHSDSPCVRLCDNAAAFQMEVPDAAGHREPSVHVGLANAVPRHEAAAPLDPKHRERVTAAGGAGHTDTSAGRRLHCSADIFGRPPSFCSYVTADTDTISRMPESLSSTLTRCHNMPHGLFAEPSGTRTLRSPPVHARLEAPLNAVCF